MLKQEMIAFLEESGKMQEFLDWVGEKGYDKRDFVDEIEMEKELENE